MIKKIIIFICVTLLSFKVYSPIAEALNSDATIQMVLSLTIIMLIWKTKIVNKNINKYIFFTIFLNIVFLLIHSYVNPSSLSPDIRFIIYFIVLFWCIIFAKNELDFLIKTYIKLFSILTVIGWFIILIDILDNSIFETWYSQNIPLLKDTAIAKRGDFDYYFPFYIFCFSKSPEPQITFFASIFPFRTFASCGFTILFVEATSVAYIYFPLFLYCIYLIKQKSSFHYIIYSCILLIGILLSGSMTAYLSLLVLAIYFFYRKNKYPIVKSIMLITLISIVLYAIQNFESALSSMNKGWVLATLQNDSAISPWGVGHSIMQEMQENYSLLLTLNGFMLIATVYGTIGSLVILLTQFLSLKSIYSNIELELMIIVMLIFFTKMSFQYADFYNLFIIAHILVITHRAKWKKLTI